MVGIRFKRFLDRIESNASEEVYMAPIHRLPNEILELVFEFAASMDIPRDEKNPLRPLLSSPHANTASPVQSILAEVCRRWRDIALGLPLLWASLYISRPREAYRRMAKAGLDEPLRWVDEYIRRSRACPLDITVDCTRITARIVIPQISAHSHRWRSLTLLVSHVGTLPSILPLLKNAFAPNLRSLEIAAYIYREGIISSEPIPSFLAGGTPRLSSIRLRRVYLGWNSFPLTGLTTLELRFTTWWPKLHSMQHLFNASPALTRLVIHDDIAALVRSISPPLPIRKNSVSIRRLKELDIRMYHPTTAQHAERSNDLTQLLMLLDTPMLESLALRELYASDWAEITTHFHSCLEDYPALQTLSLSDMESLTLTSPSASEAFPVLTHLALKRVPSSPFLGLLLPDDSFADHIWRRRSWLYLDTLTIVEDPECDLPLLQTVVICREILTKMRLVLDETIFADDIAIDWLREHAVVERWTK